MKQHMAIGMLILMMSAACSSPIAPLAPTTSANAIEPVAATKAPAANAQATLPPTVFAHLTTNAANADANRMRQRFEICGRSLRAGWHALCAGCGLR
ncbi:MAG: hypothetical protein U0559_05120 [Anaerolineae bacterium]